MKRFRKKSMMSKTFLGISMISFAVLLIMAAVAFFWLRAEMKDDYRNLTRVSVSNVDVVFNQYLKESRNLVTTWYTSAGGLQCRVAENYNPAYNNMFVDNIQDTVLVTPYIQAVYFVNRNGEVSLHLGGTGAYTEPLEELLPQKLKEVQGRGNTFTWTVGSRYKNRGDVTLLSLYYQEALSGSPYYGGAVVMNLDAVTLSKSFFSTVDQKSLKFFVLDSEGTVVLSNMTDQCGESWRGKAFLAQLLSGKETSFTAKEDGTTWEFTAVPSAQKGFYIISQSEYISIAKGINDVINVLLTVILGVSVFIIVVTVLVCARLYKPFYKIIADIRRSSVVEVKESDTDEVSFLQNFYSQLSSHISVLNNKAEKDFFVKNLLSGNMNPDIQKILLDNQVISAGRGYYAVLIYLVKEEQGEVYGMKEYDTFRNMISSVYSTLLEDVGHCTCFDLGIRRVLLIVSEKNDKPLVRSEMMDALSKASKLSHDMENSKIYTVVSEYADGEKPCAQLYQQMNDILKLKLLLGDDSMAMDDAGAHAQYPDKTVSVMLHAVKKDAKADYMKAVEQFVDSAKDWTYQSFLTWTVDAVEEIQKLRSAVSAGGRKKVRSREQIQQQLIKIKSREQLMLWFDSLYNEVAVQLEKVNSYSTVSMMEKAVDYIRNHYDDQDLNVNMLADKLGISPAYFGKLFREFAGCSAIEYLTKTRIEKAHDMLIENPKKEIAQIAREVGFGNHGYFTTIFKKYYGVSPSKLRVFNVGKEEDDTSHFTEKSI